MKKLPYLIPVLSVSFLLGGCGQDSKLRQASNTFFEAFNHLCEADTLSMDGHADLLGIDADFTFALDSSDQQAALVADAKGQPIEFYIRNGKTYLNYLGTKSSSLAANLGIEKNTPLHLPNPFLELDGGQRAALFDKVQIDGDRYIFTLNRQKLAAFLDDYGAVDVQSASLETSIVNGQFESLRLEIDGTYDIDIASTPLDATLTFDDILVDQLVSIDFPSDLNSWNA